MHSDVQARRARPLARAMMAAAMLALCLGFAFQAAPSQAFAADGNVTITSKDGTTHSYGAYQLLAGDVADGAIVHAATDGVDMAAYAAAGATEADTANAQALAEWLAANAATDETGVFTATLSRAVLASGAAAGAEFSSGQATVLREGYWLIVSDDAQPMLLLVDDAEAVKAVEKSTTPTVAKEVQEDATGEWGKADDASGGQAVSFRLTGTLPSNLVAFETYSYWFVDTLSEGLVADASSVKVTIEHADGTTAEATLEASFADQVLRVGSADIKAAVPGLVADDKIIVEYTAALDPAKCKTGLAEGNPNAVSLEYTRSPSKEGTGTTPEDRVVTYTYRLRVDKLAEGSSQALEGAKFTLRDMASGLYYQLDGSWAKDPAELVTDAEGHLEFMALDEGKYELVETAAPEGYEKVAKPMTVEIVSNAATAEEPTLSLNVTEPAEAKSADAGSGGLVLSVVDPKSPGKTTPATPHNPKTGDIVRYVGIGVLVLAVAGVVLVLAARRRRNRE